MLRAFVIHLLLMAGFACVTFGLLEWSRVGFTLIRITSLDLAHPHPVHVLILGIAMIPPAFHELHLLVLERNRHACASDDDGIPGQTEQNGRQG